MREDCDFGRHVVRARIGLCDREIATGMLLIAACIDDEANRLGRELADFGENGFAHRRGASIHQQHSVMTRILAHLDSDIAERAGEHVDVAAYVQHFKGNILLRGSKHCES